MSYYFSKTVNASFDDTVTKVTVVLKVVGFSILTEVDVKETLKKKFNLDFRRYKILGACKPGLRKSLTPEKIIGTKLPCDVIVQEISDGQVKVSAIDPLASIQAVENPKLKKFAAEIGNKLKTVIDRI